MAGASRRFLHARHISTGGGVAMSRALLEGSAPSPSPAMDATATTATAGSEPPSPPSPPSSSSAAASRITPAVLLVTVVLAVVLLASGLLHVLRRVFLKSHHGSAGPLGERQLQHLFFPAHAHDDGAGGSGSGGSGSGGHGGLGQVAIDLLPEFAYAELSGGCAAAAAAASSRKGKEKAARPFDCAVCLCEFADDDRLRLLPLCGHAFHVACIDVWLRSSATCPLCRTKLSARHLAAAAAASAPPPSVAGTDAEDQKPLPQQDHQDAEASITTSSVVLPVRLGRFTSADADGGDGDAESSAASSSRIVDGRRCYSMGSYQYVLADEHMLVAVHLRHRHGNATAEAAASGGGGGEQQEQQQGQGKTKVFARGDSFSVSKIWQWRGSKRLPGGGICGADDGMPPWAPAAKEDRSGANANTRQHGDDT